MSGMGGNFGASSCGNTEFVNVRKCCYWEDCSDVRLFHGLYVYMFF